MKKWIIISLAVIFLFSGIISANTEKSKTAPLKWYIDKKFMVEKGESFTGDVIVFGEDARIEGKFTGDLVSIFGLVVLAPDSEVEGNIVGITSTININRGANFKGKSVSGLLGI